MFQMATTAEIVQWNYPPGGWESLPPEVRQILVPDAFLAPGDTGVSQDVKPHWFDEQLFLEGQDVARTNFMGLTYASLLGIALEYALPDGMDPLIATNR